MSKTHDHFIIQGHRGVRDLDQSDCIENTFPAFNEALKTGAEIELDLQLTADHSFTIYHDEVIKEKDFLDLHQTTKIFELTTNQCQKIRYRKNPNLSLISIPELTSSIESSYQNKPVLDFEIKFSQELESKVSAKKIAELAIDQILFHWPVQNFRIRSFNPKVIAAVKSLNSSIETVLLTWQGKHNYLELLEKTKADKLAPLLSAISLDEVAALRDHGFKIIPYAVQGHGPLDIQENNELYRHLFKHFDGWTSDSPRLVYEEAQRQNIKTKSF